MRHVICTMIPVLGCLLGLASPRVEAAWHDCGTVEPFHVQTDFVLRDEKPLLNLMSQLKQEFLQTLHLTPSSRRIEVRIFRTKHGYGRYVRQRVPRGDQRPALFVKGPDVSWVYIYSQRDFSENLRHECTHALLHNSLPFLPLWLDEGIAQNFELPAREAATEHKHLPAVRRDVEKGWRPNLLQLEKISTHEQFKGNDYRASWACVHFLLNGPEKAQRILGEYLKQIEAREFVGPFSDWLKDSTLDFEEELALHFRNQ